MDGLGYKRCNCCNTIKGMKKRSGITPNTSIRVDREVLHQARVAAVTDRKTLGQWLKEAILEKIERENDVTKANS